MSAAVESLFDLDDVSCTACGRPLHAGTCTWCQPDPVLPYNGTSGWSGGDASRQRAERADADGTTSARQRAALDLLAGCGPHGMTCAEFEHLMRLGHGSASAVLSNLHKAGRIARLREQRNRQEIYVALACINGRTLSPYRPNAARVVHCATCTCEGTL